MRYKHHLKYLHIIYRGSRGRDHSVVEFTTTYAIGAYHHWCCEFKPRSLRGVLYTTLCDKVCQWLVAGRCFFSLGTPVSSINKTGCHDIAEILLKVALKHHNPPSTKHTPIKSKILLDWSQDNVSDWSNMSDVIYCFINHCTISL